MDQTRSALLERPVDARVLPVQKLVELLSGQKNDLASRLYMSVRRFEEANAVLQGDEEALRSSAGIFGFGKRRPEYQKLQQKVASIREFTEETSKAAAHLQKKIDQIDRAFRFLADANGRAAAYVRKGLRQEAALEMERARQELLVAYSGTSE